MKNDHLPLIQALKGRTKKPESFNFEVPRIFEVKHSEIPGLPGKKIGEHITVNLRGHIADHGDGRSTIHVADVKPDSTEMTNKESPDSVRVITQQSHA